MLALFFFLIIFWVSWLLLFLTNVFVYLLASIRAYARHHPRVWRRPSTRMVANRQLEALIKTRRRSMDLRYFSRKSSYAVRDYSIQTN